MNNTRPQFPGNSMNGTVLELKKQCLRGITCEIVKAERRLAKIQNEQDKMIQQFVTELIKMLDRHGINAATEDNAGRWKTRRNYVVKEGIDLIITDNVCIGKMQFTITDSNKSKIFTGKLLHQVGARQGKINKSLYELNVEIPPG